MESIEKAEKALNEVIDEAGRGTIEAVLELSARNVAGEKVQKYAGTATRMEWSAFRNVSSVCASRG